MAAEQRYGYLKETKNYLVYEPTGPGSLLGNLYIDKGELEGKPPLVTVSVKPAKAPKGKG